MTDAFRRPIGAGALLGRLIAGAILVSSGISKLMGPPEEFAAVMDAYQILPIKILMPLAHVLPWIEVCVGACLFFGIFIRGTSAAAMALFGVFIAALSSVLIRGVEMDACGCFGKWGPALKPSQTVFLDGIFFLLALMIFIDREHFFSVDRWLRSRHNPA